MSASSERSSQQSSERAEDGPRGLLRRRPDGTAPTRWWTVAAIVAAVLIPAGWLLTSSPMFSAHRIDVSGQARLSRAEVLRIARVDGDTNVVWFNAGAAERRLEESPWIAEATVSRSLPSTLRISIRERKPVAQVKARGRFLVVASDGTVLASVPRTRGLPLLRVDPRDEKAMRRLGRTAWVVGAMSPWTRSQVRSVALSDQQNVVIHLHSGVPVYYGPPTDVVDKDQALAAVLRWVLDGHESVEAINLRAPLAPTARLAGYVSSPAPAASPTPGPSPSPSASPRAGDRSSRSEAKQATRKG